MRSPQCTRSPLIARYCASLRGPTKKGDVALVHDTVRANVYRSLPIVHFTERSQMRLARPILLLAVLFASIAAASSIPDYPFVFVRGYAEQKLPPDIATCTLTLHAIDSDPATAQRLVDQRFAGLLQVLSKNHIAQQDIDASTINKSVVTNENSRNEPLKVRGYDVSRGVTFKVLHLADWPVIAHYLLAAKNVDDLTVKYGRSDRDARESDLIAKAAEDAKKRATRLATSFGRRLGAATAISQSSFESLGGAFGLSTDLMRAPEFVDINQPRADALLVPSAIKITGSVNAIFKLE